MSIHLKIAHSQESMLWGDVFRVLGVRRCQPMLSKAGVPAAMTTAPENIVQASHYFWRRTLDGDIMPSRYMKPPFQTQGEVDDHLEALRLGLLGLLSETFSIIVNYYGEGAASELYEWAQRNVVDHDQRRRWDMWNELFLRLIGALGISCALVPIDLDRLLVEKIKETVQRFLPGLLADLEDRSDLKAIPLSPIEESILALEVIQPEDEAQVDVLLIVELILRRQAAYEIWKTIDKWLTASNRELLLHWGKQQAIALNNSTDSVTLPIHLETGIS